MDKKPIYEGSVGGYSFIMKDTDVIEVWSDTTRPYPDTYISVSGVRSQKDFDIEIGDWCMKNM